MVGDKVSFDFAGTSPHKRAERASTTGHVYVFHMSFELLGPSKLFVAVYTDRLFPIADGTTLVLYDALGSQMISDSVVLYLGYDLNVQSNHDSGRTRWCLPELPRSTEN